MNQSFGIPARNTDTLIYAGSGLNFVPTVQAPRDPTTADTNYPIETIWRNDVTLKQWIRVGAGAASPSGNAIWMPFTGGSTPAVIEMNVDANTAPGTDPVVPTAAGEIIVTGGQVAAGVVGTNVIRTDSLAANTYTIEIQRSQAAAVSTIADNGVSHYYSGQFSVDANGFVQLVGGTAPAIQKVNVDTNTAPGTDPVLADGSGQIIVTGGQVAAGTVGANVIRTDSLAANTYTIEIQRSTAVASTASANNGVCHFNSGDFTVDSNGFVSLIGATPFTWLVVTEVATPASLVNNVGYICASGGAPGVLSFALPATSVLGDIVEITLDGATSWTITQGAGQQIRIGNVQTTAGAGGSLTSTLPGDTIRMVCQTANLKWDVISMIGNITVV